MIKFWASTKLWFRIFIVCYFFFLHFLPAVVLFYLLRKKDCIHLCYSPPGYRPNQIVDRNFISVTSTSSTVVGPICMYLYICCGLIILSEV